MRRYSCCKRSTKASINISVRLNIRRLPRHGVTVRLHVSLHPESDRHALDGMRLTITFRRSSLLEIKAQGLSFNVLCPRGYRLSQVSFREAVCDNPVFNVETSVLAHHLQAPHQLTHQPFRVQRWRDDGINSDGDAFLRCYCQPGSRVGTNEHLLRGQLDVLTVHRYNHGRSCLDLMHYRRRI